MPVFACVVMKHEVAGVGKLVLGCCSVCVCLFVCVHMQTLIRLYVWLCSAGVQDVKVGVNYSTI